MTCRLQNWMLPLSIFAALVTTGCFGGGGSSGVSGFFGGDSGGSDLAEVLSSIGGSGDGESGGGSGGFVGGVSSVATVSGPEPASMTLFGGGLMGLGLWRRRARGRRSKR